MPLEPNSRQAIAVKRAKGTLGTFVVSGLLDAARRLADQIFSGSWLRAPASYQALTAGMLPDRLQQDFGLAYGEAERRAGERMVKRLRRAYFAAPRRLRYVGPYYEARQRLAGRARPDLGTRLSNRLWIGRPSLAS